MPAWLPGLGVFKEWSNRTVWEHQLSQPVQAPSERVDQRSVANTLATPLRCWARTGQLKTDARSPLGRRFRGPKNETEADLPPGLTPGCLTLLRSRLSAVRAGLPFPSGNLASIEPIAPRAWSKMLVPSQPIACVSVRDVMRSKNPANKGRIETHGIQTNHESKDHCRSQDSGQKAGESAASVICGKEAGRQSCPHGRTEEGRRNRDAQN
jgi:hypothetical protein